MASASAPSIWSPDLQELRDRLIRFGGIVLAILLSTLLLATGLSSKMQRVVSAPIAHLAQVAKVVSDQKNYAVRATEAADDDLGKLTDTFNGMLSEIESRDEELLSHRDRLEQQVRPDRGIQWRRRIARKPPAAPKASFLPT